MSTPDEITTSALQPIAAELLRRINAAYAAIDTWPGAFQVGDVERIKATLPAVGDLSAFLAAHTQESIQIVGTIAVELWSGSDFYLEAGRSFIAGDSAATWSKWNAGNSAWAKAGAVAT